MISFESITQKLIENLNSIVLELQETEQIKQDARNENDEIIDRAFKFRIYDNDGEYENQRYVAEHFYKDAKEPVIIMCIRSGGGIQDTSLAINANIQIINIEVCANVSQFDDIKTIFDTYAIKHRSLNTIIDGADCKIEIGEFPEYGLNEKGRILDDSFDEIEIFKTKFVLNVTEFENAVMSNNFELNINGEKIKYNNITFQRTYEQEFDTSEQRAEAKSFSTISVFGFTAEILYQNNTALNTLVSDILSNSNFGQFYLISLNKDGKNQLDADESKIMRLTDGKVSLSHGKIISISATFAPGINI